MQGYSTIYYDFTWYDAKHRYAFSLTVFILSLLSNDYFDWYMFVTYCLTRNVISNDNHTVQVCFDLVVTVYLYIFWHRITTSFEFLTHSREQGLIFVVNDDVIYVIVHGIFIEFHSCRTAHKKKNHLLQSQWSDMCLICIIYTSKLY